MSETKSTIDRSKLKSKINTWKPKKNEIMVEQDGKIFVCHFDKIFDKPNLKPLCNFIINKSSYINQLPIITRYINFFMNCYDNENDLATAYLKIKYAIDKEKKFNAENKDALIDLIYEILFTPRMCEKITRMVEGGQQWQLTGTYLPLQPGGCFFSYNSYFIPTEIITPL